MPAFTDSAGRPWLLKMTVGANDRILESCKLDLYDQADFEKVMTDDRAALACIAAMLMPEIIKQGLSAEQFAEGLDADPMVAAIEAFRETLINFCPAAMRPTRQAMLDKIKSLQAVQVQRERKRLDSGLIDKAVMAEMDAEEQRIVAQVEARCAEVYGPSPADSESIPLKELSAN